MRVARKRLGLELRAQRFEILINGDVELEQSLRPAYFLLHEHGVLRGLGCAHATPHTPQGPCSSIFAGKRMIRYFHFL